MSKKNKYIERIHRTLTLLPRTLDYNEPYQRVIAEIIQDINEPQDLDGLGSRLFALVTNERPAEAFRSLELWARTNKTKVPKKKRKDPTAKTPAIKFISFARTFDDLPRSVKEIEEQLLSARNSVPVDGMRIKIQLRQISDLRQFMIDLDETEKDSAEDHNEA